MEIQKLITVITKVLQLQNPLNLIKRIFFENFAVGNANYLVMKIHVEKILVKNECLRIDQLNLIQLSV